MHATAESRRPRGGSAALWRTLTRFVQALSSACVRCPCSEALQVAVTLGRERAGQRSPGPEPWGERPSRSRKPCKGGAGLCTTLTGFGPELSPVPRAHALGCSVSPLQGLNLEQTTGWPIHLVRAGSLSHVPRHTPLTGCLLPGPHSGLILPRSTVTEALGSE